MSEEEEPETTRRRVITSEELARRKVGMWVLWTSKDTTNDDPVITYTVHIGSTLEFYFGEEKPAIDFMNRIDKYQLGLIVNPLMKMQIEVEDALAETMKKEAVPA